MSSNPSEPHSIASQLVLRFTLAATMLLSCGLGVFYWIVVRHAVGEDDAVLADKVVAVRAALQQSGDPSRLAPVLSEPHSGEPAVYWVRILNSSGQPLIETPRMDTVLPRNIFPDPQKSTSAVATPNLHHAGGRLFALAANTERVAGESYAIQVAQDRSADENFRKQFRVLFAIVLAFGVLAAALVAISVTRRALRPLAQMTRSVERVGPAHFAERVPPAQWPRELRPLAVAFDDMLDRLENSFTRLSQFSADLAHELRTPLANIFGEAQVALTRPRTSDEYREVIESTVTECEHLSVIVDNLLFLARAESVDKQIQPEEFDGRAAIEKIAAYYQTLAEERQIAIRCEGDGKILADPILFQRVISNLVDNALRFTPEQGEIRIKVDPRPESTEVTVSDTGAGIAKEHLPRVFDRFYRVDPSRSTDGTGLGLALVKSIVDLHGGSAEIDSEVNRGTTVKLSFPAAQTP